MKIKINIIAYILQISAFYLIGTSILAFVTIGKGSVNEIIKFLIIGFFICSPIILISVLIGYVDIEYLDCYLCFKKFNKITKKHINELTKIQNIGSSYIFFFEDEQFSVVYSNSKEIKQIKALIEIIKKDKMNCNNYKLIVR